MKVRLKRCMQVVLSCVCVLALLCPTMVVSADELDNMESKSSGIQSELDGINEELLEIGNQIAENEVKMEAVEGDMARTQEQLAIAKRNEEQQYADMELRIQYVYENDSETLLSMILTAESLADFVNKIDFVKTLNEYDRNMLNELETLRETIEGEEKSLKEQKESYADLEKELTSKREELSEKAAAASADLGDLNEKIQKLKDEKAAEEAAKEATASGDSGGGDSGGGSSNGGSSGGGSSNGGSSGGGGYIYPSGPGQLNPFVGVVYFNGHKETYYSQKVLPGYGLNIPGRHIASDGTIRDANGYLCLASSDHPKGTMVETSLGMGVVYDSGCASGTIDIYTDW